MKSSQCVLDRLLGVLHSGNKLDWKVFCYILIETECFDFIAGLFIIGSIEDRF